MTMILYINFVLCFLFYSSSASPLVAGRYGDEQTLSKGGVYSWGQWKLAPSDTAGSLYLWSDVAAMELTSGSNGWFNFLLDGEVSIMWSVGDYNSADRTSFLEGLQRARDSGAHKTLQPILTEPGTNKFVFGTWTLMSEKENELFIKNSGSRSQKTILKENLAGFIFVPVNDNEEKLLKAETLLEDLPELAAKEEQVDSPKGQCDTKSLSLGDVYTWGQWVMVPADGWLYMWSDVAAIKHNADSNGWFDFLLDGKVSTMFSAGWTSDDNGDMVGKLQRLKSSVKYTVMQAILSKPGCTKFVFGNWILSSKKEGDLLIHNSLQQDQTTTLRNGLSGFIFKSINDEEKVLTAKSLIFGEDQFGKLQQTTPLAPLEITETYIPDNVYNPKEPCDSEDTKNLSLGDVYSWGQWLLVPEDGWLYMWSDVAAIKHNENSNGWFDFLLDGKVSTMYSVGSYVDDSGDMFGKLQRLKSFVENIVPQDILSKPGCTKFVFGNWILSSKKEGDLLIHNSLDERQTTTLRNGLSGFIFKPVLSEDEIVLTAKSSIFGAGQFGKEQLQQTTTLAPLEITETYIPPNAHNPEEPCGTECAPRELAAADSGSTLHFGSLVGGELQRFPQRERLQVMVSILRVLREYSPKQGSACTADVEDSPVY